MKSLNLIRIKSLILFGILFLSLASLSSVAQSSADLTYGASFGPQMNASIINGNSWNNYLDTSNSTQSVRIGIQANLWVNKMLSKEANLQVGIGYADYGFNRVQENLAFKAKTYPGIGTGMIEDLSNSEKQLTYQYRFQYVQVPVLWNAQLYRSPNFKYRLYFSGGLALNVLLRHRLVAETISGYSIDGNTRFVLDSSGFKASPIALQLNTGVKMEYRLEKGKFFVQPLIQFFPLSVSSGDRKVYPLGLIVHVGFEASLSDLKKWKKTSQADSQ